MTPPQPSGSPLQLYGPQALGTQQLAIVTDDGASQVVPEVDVAQASTVWTEPMAAPDVVVPCDWVPMTNSQQFVPSG